jgi:hypothetical protein
MPLEPDQRVEEEVGGHKRLQTKSSRNADKARVVVTFHVEIEQAERVKMSQTPGDTDAVSIMRDHVAKMLEGSDDNPSLQVMFLSSLLQNSMSMEVDVAK